MTGTVENELSTHKYLELSTENKPFFDEPRKGWKAIIARFPDSVTDVEDMHKCFALERYGAAVFHSLQAVEHGLIELGTYIGVTDPTSGWTAVSARLKKITETKYNERSGFEISNTAFIEQVQGTVEALKNAWRNKISHAQSKVRLAATFDRNITEEIMIASLGFMSRLASDLPTKGNTP